MTSFRDSQRRSGSGLSRTFSRHGGDEDVERRQTLAVVEALELARGRGLLPSPTELCIDLTRTCKTLTPLRWHHWDHTPHKMRLTNTGCTVMVSAKWRSKVRAHLTGGPLLGRYVFSQLHFHWGQEDTEGSEHTLEGESFPLEMHMVLFKTRYLTQEAALKEIDGVVEVAYFFELSKKDNPLLEPLVQSMSKVKCAMKSTRFGPVPLSQLIPSFTTDYLLYMGSLLTGKCAHALTWIVQHQPLTVSKKQLKALRSVHGLDGSPLVRNWRKAHPPMGRTVLHVLPPHSKITHKGDHSSEVPRESRHTSFSPDWTEQEPPPEESPKKSRRFFGCFGKKNQDAAEEVPVVGSSGDSETTDTSSNQLLLPALPGQKSFCHPKVSDSMFRAMCEAGHLMSMSSSSQHSSTAGEDAHDPATASYSESGRDVINGAECTPLDAGFILLQPPDLSKTVGAAVCNPSDRRRTFGVTFLDQKDHRRAFMRPFNSLLSEVEEESDKASEAVGDAVGKEGGDRVLAPEQCGLLQRRLPPLECASSVVDHENELSTVKEEDPHTSGTDSGRASLELSTCLLNVPESPPDSLIFELSSSVGQGSEISLLTVLNEEYHESEESNGMKLSSNDERYRNVTSGACTPTGSGQCVEDFLPLTHTLLRCSNRGISWWVPLDITSDDYGTEGSSRDVVRPQLVDNFSMTEPDTCFPGEEIFTDTSTTTDTPRTAFQRFADVLSDSNRSTPQQSSGEPEALASARRSQIPKPGFKDKKSTDSLSRQKKTCSKKANASPSTPSSNLSPDVATNESIHRQGTGQATEKDVSRTCCTRTRAQKRSDEEELRFPQIKIPKRNNRKAKAQKKKTSQSMSSLQEMQKNSASHSGYQRTAKDAKVKDHLISWREMQSRKRSNRKSESKKQNRTKRRLHSSSSMDHLFLGSSSDDRARVEKKVSATFKGPTAAKSSGAASAKNGHEHQRRERSHSSSSASSVFSSSGAKCVDKVVNSGGIQDIMGSGDEMQLQEISFHYVPCRPGAAPLNRKRLITGAEHGDSAAGQSPSTLRLHLKAPVDVNQLLKKVPSASYITVDSPGAYAQEREVTVGMVLVDTLRCEDSRQTNSSTAQEITSVEEPQAYPEKSEDTPVENAKNVSPSAPAGDCRNHECAPTSQLKSIVDNAGTNEKENLEATTSSPSPIEVHSPRRKRCCNAECWICQLSTIKVIQYTQGLENSRDLPTSEKNQRAAEDKPDVVKPAGNEDEVAAVANVSTNAVQRFSSVVSRTLGMLQCSGSNERVPLPEPGPIGDVPLQQNHGAAVAVQASESEITQLNAGSTSSADPQVYRTTMEVKIFRDGTILGGNSTTSSSAGERTTESSETSKEVLLEGQKVPQTAVHDANSNSCEQGVNILQLFTANNENKGGEASTQIIDLYRKIKRSPQSKSKTVEEIPGTPTMDGLSSYTSCATESDVSLIPDEDEAVPQSSNTQSLGSGEEIRRSQNQVSKCSAMSEEDGKNCMSYADHKATLKRFKLEYEILSKVMLYATLRQLGIARMREESAAGAQPTNETCAGNEPDHKGDAIQPSLGMEVVRSVSKVPASQSEDTNTKATWTAPEDLNITTPERCESQQALSVIPEAESQRETEDTEERQQPVQDDDGGKGETNCSTAQVSGATTKTKNVCSAMLSAKNHKLSNVAEENTGNDTEVESVADSQETRDPDAIDVTSTSNSSNVMRRQLKNKNASNKAPSIAGSVKQPKLCSVEVKQKVTRPRSEPQKSRTPGSAPQKSHRLVFEPQQIRRPKRRPSRDKILSPREVYERRKMYAKNLDLRRAQRANQQADSEDGETANNFDENQSASEGKSVGEPPKKECRSKNMKFVGDYRSAGSLKLGEAGNRSVPTSRETSVKSYRGTKARVVTRMSQSVRSARDVASCSTGSTKNNSIFSAAKEKAFTGSIKLPGNKSTKTSLTGQWRSDSIKEADEASADAGRSASGLSGVSLGANLTSGAVIVKGANTTKLKSSTANDSTERMPTLNKQRCPTPKQSKKSLARKLSQMAAIELRRIEVIDKPSLCQTWLQQHYSDSSTLGSICGSNSVETMVQNVIPATKKPVDSEKSATANESHERLNKQASGGAEGEVITLLKEQVPLPSREGMLSIQSNRELVPISGVTGRWMIPFRADAVPLLTYKPQKIPSDGLKSPPSDHVQESRAGKSTPLIVNPLQFVESPASWTTLGGKRKKAKRLRDKSDVSSPTDLSYQPSVHSKKSVATSPIPLRKDSRQITVTVEKFSFCSTGVNTSLSVTRLSSRSMGVQCPSRGVSKRPSATTDLLQSVVESEVKRDSREHAASGMFPLLTEVATKLESHLLVQKSVATQWLRHASVPNLALKSPVKKSGKQTKRGSSNKRTGALCEYDLGVNEVHMETVRALHRRRLFRAFSTNSLALGTNGASARKVMRRLFRKKRKKVKTEGTESKSKCQKCKKKVEQHPAKSAAPSGSGISSGGGSRGTGLAANSREANTVGSSATHCDLLSDASGGVRKKDGSPRLLLVRGSEAPQSPALFEDLEGQSPAAAAGTNWCSLHNRPADESVAQSGADEDSDEVSAAVAQVNTGARVLRMSLADDESTVRTDLGSVEFVMRGTEVGRPPPATTSVLARLRRMLTWRT